MDINEHLAIKVMGLRLEPSCGIEIWRGNGLVFDALKNKWNPLENIDQAIMCAEAIKNKTWVAEKLRPDFDEKEYMAAIRETDRYETNFVASGDTPSEALSLACAKATGWQE